MQDEEFRLLAMNRRSVLTALGAGLWSVTFRPTKLDAQGVPLVGVYTAMGRQSQATQEYAFLEGMRDLGYIEGQNVRYEFRYGEGVPANYGPAARELAALRPAVVVSSQAVGSIPAVRDAFVDLPVVCAAITSNLNLVQNPERPEANITGILTPAIGDRERLSLAAELVDSDFVGILMGLAPTEFDAAYHQSVRAIGVELGLNLVFGISQSVDDALAAYQYLVDQGVSVISYPVSSSQFNVKRPEIIELAETSRMPTVYDRRDAVWEGGLIGIGPNQRFGWRRAASFVDRLLRGAVPSELPLEQSEAVDLAVNLTAAREIQFTVPEGILSRATEILN